MYQNRISFEDFIKHFDSVEICHLTASSFSEELSENEVVKVKLN